MRLTILRELTKIRCEVKLKTFGHSMFPLLHDSDIVQLTKTKFDSLQLNDIVCVRKNENFLTHRVIYKSKTYIITKGDNTGISDGKIYPKNIVGKVASVIRDGQTFTPSLIYQIQSGYYKQQVITLNNELIKNSINFVFLKGLPLHLHLEKTHPKRIYADCDILIDAKQLQKVKRIFKRLGYKQSEKPHKFTTRIFKSYEPEQSFYKQINGFPVIFDVHLEAVFLMTQLGKLDALYPQHLLEKFTKTLLANKQTIQVLDREFPILKYDYLFVYLLLHFFHHNFRGIFRLQIIEGVLKKTDLDHVIQIVNEYKLQNYLYPTIILFNRYSNHKVSDQILGKIKPSKRIRACTQKILSQTNIFDDEPQFSGGINRFKNIFYLSPQPLYKRLLVFFDAQVIYVLARTVARVALTYTKRKL